MARKSLGNTTVMVLHAVASGVRYGFDIMDSTSLPSGTVYPALSRLERMGHLKTRWEDAAVAQEERRPPRKYYAITPGGKVALIEAAARIRALQELLPDDLTQLEPRRK